MENDFGFNTVDDEEINKLQIQYRERLKKVEEMILPLLLNLSKNPEKEYIKWPNRKEIIDKHIEKLLKLTRD